MEEGSRKRKNPGGDGPDEVTLEKIRKLEEQYGSMQLFEAVLRNADQDILVKNFLTFDFASIEYLCSVSATVRKICDERFGARFWRAILLGDFLCNGSGKLNTKSGEDLRWDKYVIRHINDVDQDYWKTQIRRMVGRVKVGTEYQNPTDVSATARAIDNTLIKNQHVMVVVVGSSGLIINGTGDKTIRPRIVMNSDFHIKKLGSDTDPDDIEDIDDEPMWKALNEITFLTATGDYERDGYVGGRVINLDDPEDVRLMVRFRLLAVPYSRELEFSVREFDVKNAVVLFDTGIEEVKIEIPAKLPDNGLPVRITHVTESGSCEIPLDMSFGVVIRTHDRDDTKAHLGISLGVPTIHKFQLEFVENYILNYDNRIKYYYASNEELMAVSATKVIPQCAKMFSPVFKVLGEQRKLVGSEANGMIHICELDTDLPICIHSHKKEDLVQWLGKRKDGEDPCPECHYLKNQ